MGHPGQLGHLGLSRMSRPSRSSRVASFAAEALVGHGHPPLPVLHGQYRAGAGWVSVEKGVVSVEFSWVSVESNCAFYPESASFLQLIAFFRKNSTETLRFRVLKKGVNAFIFAQTQ